MSAAHSNLKDHREQWLSCLNGQDRNSIWSQVTRLIWNAAGFRVINEARRLAPQTADGEIQLNGLIHVLLNETFFESQAAGVRRLIDRADHQGPKGVYSLKRLLLDLQKHADEFTRAGIFEAEGLKYDYDDVKRMRDEYALEQERAGKPAFFVPREFDWHRFQIRHEEVDRLAETIPERRGPGDKIQPEVFIQLLNRLDGACAEIGGHVDKFIAHAATPESRAHVNADYVRITFGHLWRAHKTLCQITQFVSAFVLGSSSLEFLAIPVGDELAHIDRPLVSSADVKKLADAWKDFEQECRSWTQWGLDDLMSEIQATSRTPRLQN